MNDPGSDLDLERNEHGGSLDLPNSNWQLIIRDKSRTPGSPDKGKMGRERVEERVPRQFETPDDVCKELVDVLVEIKGMRDYKTRTYLLRGFSQSDLDGLDRHESHMRADLRYIVDHVVCLRELDALIENAKDLTRNPTIAGHLDRICSKYYDSRRRTESEKYSFPSQSYTDSTSFDVFLAHNSQDKSLVESIAEKLKQRGLNPWLDKEQIPPGHWFQDVIQQAITTVKSAAIFIGPKGLGKWQRIELHTFISQCVEADLPVIPVLLPCVSDIPEDLRFLRELNWVRFSSGIDDSEALDNLEWGITGKHPRKS